MKIKLLAIIVLVMITSLSAAGCTVGLPSSSSPTPTPTATPSVSTPTPPKDYSSYYQKLWEGSGMIVERQFTKSTNERGNDVYMGVMRNATLSQSNAGVTTVMELTKSQAEAKQLYDKYVADKLNEGFTPRQDWIAAMKASDTGNYTNIWVGQNGLQQFYVLYRYNPAVISWELTTEASR